MNQANLLWDESLIKRYDLAGPRYTSYPTAPQFKEDFNFDDWRAAMEQSNTSNSALSLYFHIPFCATVCYYCGCNKVITANRQRAIPYLNALKQEITFQAQFINPNRLVKQLHWGGGTPTYLSDEQMQELMDHINAHFHLAPDNQGEYSIEVHPQTVSPERLKVLRTLGFNRLSIGVQDFAPEVQKAVNRFNNETEVQNLIAASRALGFASVSLDLIYGLPLQTETGFADTLDKVIRMRPDRLSLFNYAHMPHMFKVQKQIDAAQLPSAQVKLAILHNSIEQLLKAGYEYIGMDHFALPSDELSKAQKNGTLHRNFQGYTTGADYDLLGFGVSSINSLADTYAQNEKDLQAYIDAVNEGRLPIIKGYKLSQDDRLRRAVINALACQFELRIAALEQQWGIRFAKYFCEELHQLKGFAEDGLIKLSDTHIQVTASGRLLVRSICMCFDKYLRKAKTQAANNTPRYSRII